MRNSKTGRMPATLLRSLLVVTSLFTCHAAWSQDYSTGAKPPISDQMRTPDAPSSGGFLVEPQAGSRSAMAPESAPQDLPRGSIVASRPWWDTTLGKTGIALGVTALSTLGDRELARWASEHPDNDIRRVLGDTKDILPIYAIGFAAATSFQSPWANEKLAHASSVALAATALTYVETVAIKQLVGRVRPSDTNDPYEFEPFGSRYDVLLNGPSFPSGHTSLSWAVITPYAKAYDAPWLYAIPVISGAGRVMDDAHWLSDVVGGAFLGYYTADFLYRHFPKGDVGMVFTGKGLMILKQF